MLNLFYFEIIDSHPDNLFLYQIRVSLETNSILPGIPELKLITSTLIFAALVSKPKIVPQVPPAKEFAVPAPVFKADSEDVNDAPTSAKKAKGSAKKAAAGSRSSSPRRSRRASSKKTE